MALFGCATTSVLMLSSVLSTWISSDGFREGLFLRFYSSPLWLPIPFEHGDPDELDLDERLPAHPAAYVRASAGLVVLAVLLDVATAAAVGRGFLRPRHPDLKPLLLASFVVCALFLFTALVVYPVCLFGEVAANPRRNLITNGYRMEVGRGRSSLDFDDYLDTDLENEATYYFKDRNGTTINKAIASTSSLGDEEQNEDVLVALRSPLRRHVEGVTRRWEFGFGYYCAYSALAMLMAFALLMAATPKAEVL